MTGIAGHRISAVEVGSVTTRYPRLIGRNARLDVHGHGPVSATVTVRTDQGAAGWGLCCGAPPVVTELVGRPLDDLFDPATGVLSEAARPLDLALHDLAGRILDRPVHALLGSPATPAAPPICYDASIYLDDVELDEQSGLAVVLANCAAGWDRGYRAIKLKIGRGHRWMERAAGLTRDIAVTRAVRETYPDAILLVDGNDGFTGSDIGRYQAAVADCELFWIEEPFPEDRAGLAALRRGLGTELVADGESDPHLPFLLELAAEGLVDVLLMDIVTFGLTAWRRVMPTLQELGVAGSPHAWGVPLKSVYAAHVAAGLGNVLAIEGVPGRCAGLELTLSDGRLSLPDGPGFGLAPPI